MLFLATTPSKKGRPYVDTPRVSRKSSVGPVSVPASPFRRTTRAMSQEKDITASPLLFRSVRRSTITESDNEDAPLVDSLTPMRSKSARKKRQSMISPTVDLIAEEDEPGNKTLVDELELRTRSISKSPSVNGSPPKPSSVNSLHDSLTSKNEANESGFGVLEQSQSIVQKQHTIYRNRNKEGVSDKSDSDQHRLNTLIDAQLQQLQNNEESKSVLSQEDLHDPSPIKKYSSKKCLTLQVAKTVFSDVVVRASKSAEQPKDDRKMSDEIVENSQPPVSLQNTPIRGRRSIREGESSSEDQSEVSAKVAELLTDFVSDDKEPCTPLSSKKRPSSAKKLPEEMNETPKSFADKSTHDVKTPKSGKKTPKADKIRRSASYTPMADKTESSAKQSAINSSVERKKSSIRDEDIIFDDDQMMVSDVFDSEMTLQTSVLDMEVSRKETPNSSRQEKSAEQKVETLEDTSMILSPSLVQRSASGKMTPQNRRESLNSYIHKAAESSSRMSRTSASGEGDGKPGLSWNQSVQKVASTSIDGIAKDDAKVVFSGSMELKDRPVSSDESDDEHEKNSFVDDEANLASGESICESEKEYLKQQEIVDDGESLGSQDSDEFDESSDQEDDSFIVNEEELSNQYDLNSEEERIETHSPKKRRRSRIISPSISEDEQENEIVAQAPDTVRKLESQEVDQSTANAAKNAMETDQTLAKKSKRKRESHLNQSISVKAKRAKIEAPADHDLSDHEELIDSDDDEEQTQKSPEKVKQKSKSKSVVEPVDIETVLSKCEELMSAHNAEKKVKAALKREKKAQKAALKKQLETSEQKQKSDTLDSSNGSNKENLVKKKKKTVQKKQKPVDGECYSVDMLLSSTKTKLISFDFF